MIITIDGPAGSGKGTLAKKLAEVLDFYHLDTGLLYRGVAFVAQQMGTDITNEDDLVEIASNLQLTQLNKLVLSNENIGRAASDIARLARVRIALLDKQRKVAHHPPLSKLGAVLDGRDTGTIVCPDANIKFFLTASLAAFLVACLLVLRVFSMGSSGMLNAIQALSVQLREAMTI